jgi:ABC-type amino acid transport substrate-binding protein
MGTGKTHVLAAVLVALAVTMAVAACGDESMTEPSPAATSAAEIAQEVLGRAPTGLAKDIIERGSMIVANDANYAPQSSVDKTTGELVGFDVDVANKAAELLSLHVEFRNPAWETTPTSISQGKYDVSIGSMASVIDGDQTVPQIVRRLKLLDFSEPYYYTPGQVLVKKGGIQITGPDDLAGKTVGVGAGATYYAWLKENSNADVRTYATVADSFPDLRNGNLDFVMTAGPTGQQAISQGQPFEFSGTPLCYEDLSMAVKKGEADWLALLNYTVQTMHADGSLTAMSKRWYYGLDLTERE